MESPRHPKRVRSATPRKKDQARGPKESRWSCLPKTDLLCNTEMTDRIKLESPSPKKATVLMPRQRESSGKTLPLNIKKETTSPKKVKVLMPKKRKQSGRDDIEEQPKEATAEILLLSSDTAIDPLSEDATQLYEMLPEEYFVIEMCDESAVSPEHNVPKPNRKAKMLEHLYYGSEEESDGDADLANDHQLQAALAVPRAARVYLQHDEDNCDVDFPQPDDQTSFPPPCFYETRLASPLLSDPKEFGPHKWTFNWENFPENPVPPKERREYFDSSNCGPTVAIDSPYEAFTSIWTPQIMEHIARETNKYAEEVADAMLEANTMGHASRIAKWRPTSPDELYVLFAIIMATGVVVKSRMEEYWIAAKDLFWTPGFTSAMTYDRFQILSRCLHFQDNSDIDPQAMTRSQAKLFKIQPILDHLNDRFSTLYNLKQNIALDESLTQWKGWLEINQFMNNKAASVGIKTYEVCESQSGYLWRFEVHAGHDGEPPQESPVAGIIPTLVLRLVRGLEGRGHTIWMDNYYNSPALARELKCRGFDCAGTLRANRKFVPYELASLTNKCMTPGEVRGNTAGDVDVLVWWDHKVVPLISTYHGAMQAPDSAKPGVVHDYNICMGGVDLKDQMLAMFPIERKRTLVWYKKLFKRLINVSVLNAYILYKHNHKINHRKFRKEVCLALLKQHGDLSSPSASLLQTPIKESRYTRHLPGERRRRNCKLCPKRTITYCEACDVNLCLKTCFKTYHTPPQSRRARNLFV